MALLILNDNFIAPFLPQAIDYIPINVQSTGHQSINIKEQMG